MSFEAYRTYAREEMRYATSTSKRLAIDTHDGVHIGNCMYYDINRRRGVAELGIMIGDRRYWGAGYGTDAVRTLLNHIFTTTDLDSVYLHTLKWNDRARQSFAKAGFREMRTVFPQRVRLRAHGDQSRRVGGRSERGRRSRPERFARLVAGDSPSRAESVWVLDAGKRTHRREHRGSQRGKKRVRGEGPCAG